MEKQRALFLVTLGMFTAGQLMLYLIGASLEVQVLYGLLFIGVIFFHESYSIFIYRILTPISIGIFFTLLYTYAYSIDALSMILKASFRLNFMLEKFFTVISTLYAICIAFLLWKGLTDHDNLKSELNREASIVRNILSYTYYYNTKENIECANKIKRLLSVYMTNIIDKNANESENDKILKECIEETSRIDPADVNDEIALSEIMKNLTELGEARARRKALMETKMSPYMLLAILLMSISIMFPFYTKTPMESGVAGYVMIFTMSSLLAFMFITMLDLRDPFMGFWKIKMDAFQGVLQDMEDNVYSMDLRGKAQEIAAE